MIAKNLELTVGKFKDGVIEPLYELIPDFEKAHLLALLEMPNAKPEEDIVIVPRWSFLLDKKTKEEQQKLANMYGI